MPVFAWMGPEQSRQARQGGTLGVLDENRIGVKLTNKNQGILTFDPAFSALLY
jgi:hypothetical protein